MYLRDDVYVVRGTSTPDGGAGVAHDLSWPGQEDDGVDAPGASVFGHPGIVCRPAPPDDGGKCEAIAADIGGDTAIVGMRDTRAAAVAGNLEPGDYCYISPQGRCGLWCKASGVVSLRKDGADGSTDSAFQFEADGSAKLVTPFGGFECGPNGWLFYTAGGEVIQLTAGLIQAIAAAVNLVGAVGLGPAPAVPLVQSTPGPQIGATALPVLGIKITPG